MNKRQLKDADECEQMADKGLDKDCNGCSCRVCLVQEGELLHAAEIGKAIMWAQENMRTDRAASSFVYHGRIAFHHYDAVVHAYKRSKEAQDGACGN